MADDHEKLVDNVEVDGLVVLRIIQHAQDHWPELVTGQLLGLDRVEDGLNVLEVTSSFPYPSRTSDLEDDATDGGETYQMDMMRCLREVNFDYNTVGWYSSSVMGSFLDMAALESQFNFQTNIKKSIVVVYDPLHSSHHAALSLRAFRLSSAFMDLYKSGTFTKDSIAKSGLSFDQIYVELPVKVHNAQLATALLTDLLDDHNRATEATGAAGAEAAFGRLELPGQAYVEKHVESVIDCLDELAAEHGKLQYYQRNLQRQLAQHNMWLQKRKAENAARKAAGEEALPETDPTFKLLPEPSRLESLILEDHVEEYCRELNQFSDISLAKLFLFDAVVQQQ